MTVTICPDCGERTEVTRQTNEAGDAVARLACTSCVWASSWVLDPGPPEGT